jgi:hypothetical protein
MSEQRSTRADVGHRSAGHSYPADLARFVRDRWRDVPNVRGSDPLPEAEVLDTFFSACYQASLQREEERPVTFRAILASPTLFAADARPPNGLQRLEFSQSVPFDPAELRRLSVAADPQRTLIGVWSDQAQGFRIWGLINSGTRWLRDVQGGRRAGAPLPPAPVVHVHAPGSIEAYRGYELIARLQAGRLSGSRVDLFESEWLPDEFSGFRDVLMERHETAARRRRERSGEAWAPLEPTLPRRVSERMMKRVISVLRAARHGGTIIFVPFENGADLGTEDPYVDLKYRFADGPPQDSFPDLVVDILNRLAEGHGGGERGGPVGWREFEAATDDELVTLDEALFDTAHLIAGLAAVDGAVVMSKNHKLLGFGGMISGRLPAVRRIARALDVEGHRVSEEETGDVGARHRSAYRFVAALPGAVVIVISQDGGVRFVAHRGGRVTYWEQE